jgi:lysophospholipase L1-like esterase
VSGLDFPARGLAIGARRNAQRSNRFIGRRIAFLGDSITNGSAAQGGYTYFFTTQVTALMGTASVAPIGFGSTVYGNPGELTATIWPKIDQVIAAGHDTLIYEAGTNDARNLTPLSQFVANELALYKRCKEAGLALFRLTVPPLGPGTDYPSADQTKFVNLYNWWLRQVVPLYGTLIDVHDAMINRATTTPVAVSAYASGDGIHPNNLGHRIIAEQIVKALKSATRPVQIDAQSSLNLCTNGFFITDTAGWYEQPGGTGTALALSRQTDTSGFLQYGQWYEADIDASAATVRTLATTITSSGWAVGDVLAITAKVQVSDVSGTWAAKNTGLGGDGTTNIQILPVNGSAGTTIPGWNGAFVGAGNAAGGGLYNFGPNLDTFVIPSGLTSLALWMRMTVPSGSHFKIRIGEVGVVNMTATGLATIPMAISA